MEPQGTHCRSASPFENERVGLDVPEFSSSWMTPGSWGAQGYDQGPAGEVRESKVRWAGDLSHSQVHAPRVATKLGWKGGGKRE